jgi:short chain dehydrogenase
MELGLRGKKALVTGGSKGIGRACAEVLAEEGCDVVLVARTAADLEAARAAIAAKHNVAVRVFALDLADSRNVDRLAAECPDTEILINNAGAIPGGTIDEVDETRWRTAWDLKVFGYINMTRRFYGLMRERKRGDQHCRRRRRESRFRLHRRVVGQRLADGVHPGDGRRRTSRRAARRRHQPRAGPDRPADHLDPPARAVAVRRSRAVAGIDARSRLWPRRQARGDRLDGGVSGVRQIRLYDRRDRHD